MKLPCPKFKKYYFKSIEKLTTERLALLFTLTLTIIVNYQILSNYFFQDDFIELYQISNWNFLEFLFSSTFGGHLYVFRNFVYFLTFKLFGMHAFAYFSIVLLTHVFNAYLLYKLIYVLTGKSSYAAIGSTIWGICPVNYGTIGWYAAYGHVLVGSLILLFLYDLLKTIKREEVLSFSLSLRWSTYCLLMASSYGFGLVAACLAPILIVIIFWEKHEKTKIALSMLPVILLILLLYFFKDSIYHFLSGEMNRWPPVGFKLDNYKNILTMSYRMCAYGIYCIAAFPLLFVFPPESYPIAAFVISIPILLLAIYLCVFSKKNTRYYFGFGLLLSGLIAIVSYGRAPFSHLPLFHDFYYPISTTPHFLYVVLMITTLILSLMASELADRFYNKSKIFIYIAFTLILVSVYPSIKFAPEIGVIGMPHKKKFIDDRKVISKIADTIEESIQNSPEGAPVYIDNTFQDELSIIFLGFLLDETSFPGKAAIFSLLYPENSVDGKKIYFVEGDCSVAEKNIMKRKWRISSLLISACAINSN